MFLGTRVRPSEEHSGLAVPRFLAVPKSCAPDGKTVSFAYSDPARPDGKAVAVRVGSTDYRHSPGGLLWTAVEIDYSGLGSIPVVPAPGISKLTSIPVSRKDIQDGVSRMCWLGPQQIPLCGTITEISPDGKVCAATETETHPYDLGAFSWLMKNPLLDTDAPVGPVVSSEQGIVCAAAVQDDLAQAGLGVTN
jgi:hypothetical protein